MSPLCRIHWTKTSLQTTLLVAPRTLDPAVSVSHHDCLSAFVHVSPAGSRVKRRSATSTPPLNTGTSVQSPTGWDLDPSGIAVIESDANPVDVTPSSWSMFQDFLYSFLSRQQRPQTRFNNARSRRASRRGSLVAASSAAVAPAPVTSTASPHEEKTSLLPNSPPMLADAALSRVDVESGGVRSPLSLPAPVLSSAVPQHRSSRDAIDANDTDASDDEEDEPAPPTWDDIDSKYFTPFFTVDRSLASPGHSDDH